MDGGPYLGCDHVFTNVQAAVNAATGGETIKVAGVVYTGGPNSHYGYRQMVYITKSLTVQGGYTVTDWSAPDPVANVTVLDAQGEGQVLLIEGDITVTVEGLCITGGSMAGSGGGGYVRWASVAFINNRIFSNTAYGGGGLWLTQSDAILEGNVFSDNRARDGGAAYLTQSTVTVVSNTFVANNAEFGGGLWLIGSEHTVNVVGNTIVSNTGRFGGGLYLYLSDAVISGNRILSNSADIGGGMLLEESDADLINNVIADNRVRHTGAGLIIYSASPRLLHNTVVNNVGGDGSGIEITNWSKYSFVTLTNTILISHAVGITVSAGNTARMEATLWGNETDWRGMGNIITGTRNIWGDPAFVAPAAGDYRINLSSAAVDAGVNAGVSIDIEGELRPLGGGYDIGADERSALYRCSKSCQIAEP